MDHEYFLTDICPTKGLYNNISIYVDCAIGSIAPTLYGVPLA